MPAVLERLPRKVDADEVQRYIDRGHWGYILDYRETHHGDDPDPDLLDALAEVSESQKNNAFARFVKRVWELLR